MNELQPQNEETKQEIAKVKKKIETYKQEIQQLKEKYYLHEKCLQNITQKFPKNNMLYLRQVFVAELIKIQLEQNKYHLVFDKNISNGLRDLEGWGYAWLYLITNKKHAKNHQILYNPIMVAQDQSFELDPILNYNSNYLNLKINSDNLDIFTYSFINEYEEGMETIDQIQLVILVKIEKQHSNMVEISSVNNDDKEILDDPNTHIIDFKVYHVVAESYSRFAKE